LGFAHLRKVEGDLVIAAGAVDGEHALLAGPNRRRSAT
jgi:hypothetical protein